MNRDKTTDTNQASEGEQRTLDDILSQAFTDGASDTMWQIDPRFKHLAEQIESMPGAVFPIPKGALTAIEKLKLLAEVREEAFSGGLSFELDDGQIVIEVETDLQSIIAKLEAEL